MLADETPVYFPLCRDLLRFSLVSGFVFLLPRQSVQSNLEVRPSLSRFYTVKPLAALIIEDGSAAHPKLLSGRMTFGKSIRSREDLTGFPKAFALKFNFRCAVPPRAIREWPLG